MLATYRPLFEVPGARRFIVGGFTARSEGSMFGLSAVAVVAARTGSYELAGAVVAVGMVSLAVCAPFLGRLVDRYGQRRIAIPFFLWSGFWAVMTVLPSLRGWPTWLLCITFPLCGAIPNLGTMARALVAHLRSRPAQPALGDVVRAGHGGGHLRHRTGARDLAVDGVLPRGRLSLRHHRLCRGRPRLRLRSLDRAAGRAEPRAPHGARPHGAGARSARLHHGHDGRDLRSQRGRHARRVRAGPCTGRCRRDPGLYAVGSAVAGLLFGHFSHGRNLVKLLMVGTLGMAVLQVPVFFAPDLWALAGVMLVAGMATAPTLITTMNLIERIVPRSQLNEGMTIVLTGLIIGIAAGSAVSGVVIDRIGAQQGYVVAIVAGGFAFVMALGTRAFLTRRELHNLR